MPEQLREPSLPRSTDKIHLPKPILRMHESQREEEVVLVGCADVWDAEFIARDINGLFESCQLEGAGNSGEGFSDLIPYEERPGQEEENQDAQNADKEFSPLTHRSARK